jgi:hypothetical protein
MKNDISIIGVVVFVWVCGLSRGWFRFRRENKRTLTEIEFGYEKESEKTRTEEGKITFIRRKSKS